MIAEEEDFIVLCLLGGWWAVCSLLVDSQRVVPELLATKGAETLTKKLARWTQRFQVGTRLILSNGIPV
jgi:hypothetical protein